MTRYSFCIGMATVSVSLWLQFLYQVGRNNAVWLQFLGAYRYLLTTVSVHLINAIPKGINPAQFSTTKTKVTP